MMALNYQKYTFHCILETEARVPAFMGSALRGTFGRALKKTACALRNQTCDTCLLNDNCGYAFIFETERYKNTTGKKTSSRPHPFVLEPPSASFSRQKKGDRFSFSILLIDKANDFLPHVIYSVNLMGQDGIGSGTRHGMGRFLLDRVRVDKETIYHRDEGKVRQPENNKKLILAEPTTAIAGLEIFLKPPLRFKYRNRYQDDLPFDLLVRIALRRIAILENAYGGGEPPLDYRGLIHRAGQVTTVNSDLSWTEIPRYSNRQRVKMLIGGLTGKIRFRGDLGEFMPLLNYCEIVHLGKQTAFGLGQIKVRPF